MQNNTSAKQELKGLGDDAKPSERSSCSPLSVICVVTGMRACAAATLDLIDLPAESCRLHFPTPSSFSDPAPGVRPPPPPVVRFGVGQLFVVGSPL